jgi:PAS domain S-box-containing protein
MGAENFIIKSDNYIQNLVSAIKEVIEKNKIQDDKKRNSPLVFSQDTINLKRAEEKLIKCEEMFSRVFNALPDAFALISIEDQKFIEVNDGFLKIVNLKRDEVIGHTIAKINFWPDYQSILKYMEKLYQDGTINKLEVCFQTNTGVTRHCLLSGTIIEFDNKKCSLFFALDIEEQFQMKEALLKSETILNTAQSSAHIGSWQFNSITQETIWSAEMFRIFDHDPSLGTPSLGKFLEFVHPDDRNQFHDNLSQTVAKLSNFYHKCRFICSDGKIRWIESKGKPILDNDGKMIQYVGIAQDISERELSEQALLQMEENFHRSISESPFGIRIVTVNGETVYANKALLDIYELSSFEEYTRLSAKSSLTPESYAQHQERKEKRKKGQSVDYYEKSIITKNGKTRVLRVFYKDILWNGIKHSQVITMDITEKRKLTLELIAAKEKAEESERLKSSFLCNMSHEIRTPMNAIIGFSELLTMPDLSELNKQQYAAIVRQRSLDLLKIIDDMIDVSKIEVKEMELIEVDFILSELMSDLYEEYKHRIENDKDKSRIDLKLDVDDNLNQLIVHSDSQRIKQILVKLIDNAIKFTSEGSIVFGYEIAKGKELVFHVQDTGVGIPVDKQDIIFDCFRQADDRYSTRQYGGTGLGLYIAKGLVSLLKGRMWLDSEAGKGSVFYFSFPFTEPDRILQ